MRVSGQIGRRQGAPANNTGSLAAYGVSCCVRPWRGGGFRNDSRSNNARARACVVNTIHLHTTRIVVAIIIVQIGHGRARVIVPVDDPEKRRFLRRRYYYIAYYKRV